MEGGNNDKRTEEIWKRITGKFNQVIDENVPTIKANRKKNKLSSKVYAVKKQGKIREHDKIWKEYCKVRNKVMKISKQARKDYENNIANGAKKNPERVYAYVNSKMKVKPGVGNICRDPNNPKSEVTANDKEKTNIFSKYPRI